MRSGVTAYRGYWLAASAATTISAQFNDSASNWQPTVPATWAANDVFTFDGFYEAA